MYNGKTLENIQEACRSLLDVNEKIDPILYAQFRKNYIDNDLKRIFDDIEMVAEPLPDYKIEDFEEILAMPTGTQIEYIETIEEDVEEIVRKPKPLLHQTSTASSFKSGNMKNKQGKENLDGEDEFLMEFDPSGKFLKMTLPLIMKMEHKLTFDDIAGLERAKEELKEAVILPLLRPDIFQGIRSPAKGILLFGPPGTGKTLVAKAIATECELNFKSIKGPELLNQYIGESESNIRKLFQEAKQMAPCVLFFDELDALAPKRGVHSDSGGVMDRLVSQLLNELDGISQLLGIVVIGATNRPDLLDPALTRPGRFDNMIYLGPCEEKQQVLLILQAQLSKYTTMDLSDIADQLPLPITGADLFGFTGSALQHAIDRMIKNNIDDTVMLQLIDFEHALRQYSPSLTIKDMKQYDLLKAMER